MKFTTPVCILILFVLSGFTGCPEADTGGEEEFSIELNFSGPDTSSYKAVYTAWIEDAQGNNLQNLYVCNTVLGIGKTLTGTALPFWKTEKYSEEHPENFPTTDGVTGASVQGSFTIERTLNIGGTTRFRVCFEIDRSLNANDYFTDRPAFIYQSDLINLNALETSYDLDLTAYMPNGTLSGTWSQNPKEGVTIPDFEAYAYLTSLEYIAPHDNLVTGLTAVISGN